MTERKVKKHLHRIWFHFYRLQSALNDAHNKDVIKYENYDNGPCKKLYELRDRIYETTKEQAATAVHESVKEKIR